VGGPIAGVGVDYYGGQVYDPTQNVRELVEAESKYQDAMRDSLKESFNSALIGMKEQLGLARSMDDKFSDYTRKMEGQFQNAQREGETKRIDQLAQNRQEFQNTIRDMLAESVRTTSTLVSKLEAYQFTQAGKASVADPQIAETMAAMSRNIGQTQTSLSEAMQKSTMATAESIAKLTLTLSSMQISEGTVGGRSMGREQSNARMLAIIGTVGGVAGVLIAAVLMSLALTAKPQTIYLPAPSVQSPH
jgi:hypothetical protein